MYRINPILKYLLSSYNNSKICSCTAFDVEFYRSKPINNQHQLLINDKIYNLIYRSDKVLYDFIQSQVVNDAPVLKTDEQMTEEATDLEGFSRTSFDDDLDCI